MRDRINGILDSFGVSRGSGFELVADAVELYGGGRIGDVYAEIALRRGRSVAAVEKAIAKAISLSEAETSPKAFIAYVKERSMLNFSE